jgi:probable phosphoglycerate mutase
LAGLDAPAEVREALLEWDYGEYQGQTLAQVLEGRPDWDLWKHGCPGGETAAQVGARVDGLLAELASEPGRVALFAHGHLLRVLAARWMGLPAEGGARLALSTASVSVLGTERGNRVLWTWNDVSHLQR